MLFSITNIKLSECTPLVPEGVMTSGRSNGISRSGKHYNTSAPRLKKLKKDNRRLKSGSKSEDVDIVKAAQRRISWRPTRHWSATKS